MKKSNKIEIEKRVLKFIERRNKQLKETEKYKALALVRGDLDYIYDKCRRGIIALLETSDNRFHNEIAEQISCLYNQRNFNLNELDELIKIKEFYKNLNKKQKKEFNQKIKRFKDEIKKYQKIATRNKPKTKNDRHLINYYIEKAYRYKKRPGKKELDSSGYSYVSFTKKLNNICFVFLLKKECEKRADMTNISKNKKDILLEIIDYCKNQIKKLQARGNKTSNLRCIPKELYNDNINYDTSPYKPKGISEKDNLIRKIIAEMRHMETIDDNELVKARKKLTRKTIPELEEMDWNAQQKSRGFNNKS